MIEIIYNENEKQESEVAIKPPKNIRQIGNPRGRHKIYMEDYVYTFLHGSVFEENRQKRGVILLGKSQMSQDIRYTFISGAINCSDFVFKEDGIVFDEDCWEYIYKEIKEYFPQQEIVGWFMGMNGFPLELTPVVEAAHRKYFTGRDKVLVLSEITEGEDALFTYEQGVLQRKEGYYIYYEKNLPMQEYMVGLRERTGRQEGGIVEQAENREVKMDEVVEERKEVENQAPSGDRLSAEDAIQNYRNMLLDKKSNTSQKKMNMLLYTAASAAMIILCVIGITGINNHEKMKELEQTLAVLAQNAIPVTENPQSKQDTVTVETVPGEVTPEVDEGKGMEEQTALSFPENVEVLSEPVDQGDTNVQTPVTADQEVTTVQPPITSETISPTPQQKYYTVQAGDSLELICKKIYENTDMMDELCAVNHIDNKDKIYEGQKLILP